MLKIKAKLGELMPADNGGRGKKTPVPDTVVLSSHTVAAYRKLAANRERLEESLPAFLPEVRGSKETNVCWWWRQKIG